MPAVIEVEIKTSCPGMVNVELLDKEHTVLTKKIENTGNPSVFRMEIPDAKLWDCDHPNLYTCLLYTSTEKTGNVIGAKAVNEENEIMMITTEGIIIRLQCSDISILGRITSGVKPVSYTHLSFIWFCKHKKK